MSSLGEFGPQQPEKQINDLRQEFNDILKRFKELEVHRRSSDQDLTSEMELLHEVAGLMVQRTIYDLRELRIKVTILEDTRAETSSNWQVFDPDAREFDALQIEDMGFSPEGFKTIFFDFHPTYPEGLWLTVYGFGIGIDPYFPAPAEDAPAE